MNDAPTLDDLDDFDDFEQDIVRTLRAKADQIEVDDGPFDATARPTAVGLRRTEATAPSRRRILAIAAAVAVLGGAVIAAQRLGPDRGPGAPGRAGPDAVAAAPHYTTPETGPAAFVPATVPEGWRLAQVDTSHSLIHPDDTPATTWQLFAADGPSPLDRGVLVNSTATGEGSVSVYVAGDELHTVREGELFVTPSERPEAPAGALEAVWIDGDVKHEAVAVGMSEAELRGFLDGLVPHDDPSTGFEAPATSGLPLLDTSVVEDQYLSSLTYVGPAWDGDTVGQENDTVAVDATYPDAHGGLLHRLMGSPEGDGLVLRASQPDDEEMQGYVHVSRLRPDGWTVSVSAGTSPTVRDDPAVLDAFLDGVQPVTQEELVEVAASEPVTASEAAGGWSVDVHGNGVSATALCFTLDGGPEACTTAENMIEPDVSTGSVLVGGQWVVAVVGGDGTGDGTGFAVHAVRPGAEGPPYAHAPEDRVPGERGRLDDGRAVELFAIPADVTTAVVVQAPSADGERLEVVYDRPPG